MIVAVSVHGHRASVFLLKWHFPLGLGLGLASISREVFHRTCQGAVLLATGVQHFRSYDSSALVLQSGGGGGGALTLSRRFSLLGETIGNAACPGAPWPLETVRRCVRLPLRLPPGFWPFTLATEGHFPGPRCALTVLVIESSPHVAHCPGLSMSITGGSSESHSFYCTLSFCFQHRIFLLPERPRRIRVVYH